LAKDTSTLSEQTMKTVSTLLFICLLLVANNNCNAKGSNTSLRNLNPYFNTNGLGLRALHNAEVDSNKRKDRKTRTLTSPLITTKSTSTAVTDTTPPPPPPQPLQTIDNDTVLFQQAAIVGLISATMGHIYGLILDRSVNVVWKDIPNFILGSGKSALVLFCHMNSCVQYEVSTRPLLHLTLLCLH